ncbi:MAG TPA: AarF/UbiB family protein [Cyclobacteriaceae bacterium]|jgi:predicted unusual protein kinase regulating ubiquinone biosynthesis (AarF/ABC1/UbiB family)
MKDEEENQSIPVSKVHRVTQFLTTGARIGTNYLRHYGRKLVDPDTPRDLLHEANADDIYDSLSRLKGSALKVAQMLSMDRNLLPAAYQRKFAMAQYSVPPLSYPLVVKTFRSSFGKGPEEIFDTFTHKAVNAASMGQVHKATLGNRTFAVKIQYPGVADSVKSDLAMVRPIALSMFHLSPTEYDQFISEVEARMLEETDYELELQRSIALSTKSKVIPHVVFPKYYPEYSSTRILTMDWLDGEPLGEALKQGIPSDQAHILGQAMWDFYHFQMHKLRAVHADPHPGNFILMPDGKLAIIDFGCVKEIPDAFHSSYFQLHDPSLFDDEQRKIRVFSELGFIYPDDSPRDRAFFIDLFTQLVALLGRPFRFESFDFADDKYFATLYDFGEKLANLKELRRSKKPRGVRDAIYLNRTYFGLYTILHDLKVRVRIKPSYER